MVSGGGVPEPPAARIEPCTDVRPYFHAEVTGAADALGMPPDSVAAAYLSEMLTGLSRHGDERRLNTPLADLLVWAMAAGDTERPQRFRHLGDVSLLISGFFPDSFERRGLTYRYVESMGRGAYVAADAAVESRIGRREGSVFGLLAEGFAAHVRVLDEVRERTSLQTRGGILALYERWQGSRSPRLGARLARLGLLPRARRGGEALH